MNEAGFLIILVTWLEVCHGAISSLDQQTINEQLTRQAAVSLLTLLFKMKVIKNRAWGNRMQLYEAKIDLSMINHQCLKSNQQISA